MNEIELPSKKYQLSLPNIGGADYNSLLKKTNRDNLDEELTQEGSTILHLLAFDGITLFIDAFITLGANPNIPDKLGQTPLHYASYGGQIDAINLFLGLDVDQNALTKTGDTPLHYACMSGKKDVAYTLLKSTAVDINHANNMGLTALHVTMLLKHSEISELLLKSGAKITPLTKDDYNMLHVAVAAEDVKLVKLILAHEDGISMVEAKNNKLGWKPIDFAKLTNNTEIAELLRSKEILSLPTILEYEKLNEIVATFQKILCQPGFAGGYIKETVIMPIAITGSSLAIKLEHGIGMQLFLRSIFGGATYIAYDNIISPILTGSLNEYCKSYAETLVTIENVTSLIHAAQYVSANPNAKAAIGPNCPENYIIKTIFEDIGVQWSICELAGNQQDISG